MPQSKTAASKAVNCRLGQQPKNSAVQANLPAEEALLRAHFESMPSRPTAQRSHATASRTPEPRVLKTGPPMHASKRAPSHGAPSEPAAARCPEWSRKPRFCGSRTSSASHAPIRERIYLTDPICPLLPVAHHSTFGGRRKAAASDPNPRVRQCIRYVGEQVHPDIGQPHGKDASLHKSIIPVRDCGKSQTPNPRPRKNRLRHNRAR